MAFCSSSGQFARGWLAGGNRRRFEALAAAGAQPMGVLASVSGEPVGWCACGPRARYAVAASGRSVLLRDRLSSEDVRVWLLPCMVVAVRHRGSGVTSALVRAAVEVARGQGASAVEAWPLARSVRRSENAFLGREEVFDRLGFHCVARPARDRAIMRLELGG